MKFIRSVSFVLVGMFFVGCSAHCSTQHCFDSYRTSSLRAADLTGYHIGHALAGETSRARLKRYDAYRVMQPIYVEFIDGVIASFLAE